MAIFSFKIGKIGLSKSYAWQNRMGKQSSDGPFCLPIRDVEAQIVWANSLVTDRDAESDGPDRLGPSLGPVTWSVTFRP